MVNKRVPEWLNSFMWSSPATGSSPQPKSRSQSSPLHEDRITNHTSKSFKVTSVNASVNETRESPPSPGVIRTKLPSESVTEAPKTRTKVRDPLARSGSSDIAQLLEEVSNCLHMQS
ncbi:hypothetical protein QVD17_41918 [Tagetes erecta]|uniref:Uncharacterized protein n=1 Tax=Tagetes erecta TaxID=13708 RepID=A0AAD8JMU4_TARER|nr:hypothetical protein QVD17_41918 [Tagetes erecta]